MVYQLLVRGCASVRSARASCSERPSGEVSMVAVVLWQLPSEVQATQEQPVPLLSRDKANITLPKHCARWKEGQGC